MMNTTTTLTPEAPAIPPPTLATISATIPSAPVRRVTPQRVIRAEWIKLRSVRSNIVGLGSAAVVLVLLGMLFASLVGSDEGGPTGSSVDPLSISLGGINLSQLIIGILGAVFVAGEYSTGLIRTMFAAVAERVPVLRAKAVVFGGATWVLMTVAAFAAFFAGQAVYAGTQATYSLGDPGVLRSVLGAGIYAAGVGLIGVALGFLVRSTAAAIGGLVGLLMLAPVLIGLLPSSISDTIGKFLPSNAGSAFMTVSAENDLLSPVAGFGVFAIWVVGALMLAAVKLRRRDA